MITRPYNTKEKGLMEFFVFQEDKQYVGVCLTFDIVEVGNDPQEILRSVQEAAELHLETS